MNEPVKDGDIVMILSDNYNTEKAFKYGDICRVIDEGELFYAYLLYESDKDYWDYDDLGYYKYKKMDTGLWRLL